MNTQPSLFSEPSENPIDLSEPLHVAPVTRDDAFAFVARHHRHLPTTGPSWLFGVSLRNAAGQIRAVGYLSRPVARRLDDGLTVEIARVATLGQHNACSMIYGALRKASAALGYQRVITYTLSTEPGSSLRAAGFVREALTAGGEWARESRARKTEDPSRKVRWIWRALEAP